MEALSHKIMLMNVDEDGSGVLLCICLSNPELQIFGVLQILENSLR